MSKDSKDSKDNEPTKQSDVLPVPFDRNMILNILLENIQIMNNKFQDGRIKNPVNEKIKITQMKAVIYACKVCNEIYKDLQIDELNKEIGFLKSIIEQGKNQETINEDLKIVEDTLKKISNIEI